MSLLLEMIADGRQAQAARDCPRAVVSADAWAFAARQLASGGWVLTAMWAEPGLVHLALMDPAGPALGIMSLEARESFPSIAAFHPPAARLERTICELHGMRAEGAPDTRPWLDHGRWGLRAPLGAREPATDGPPYEFLAAQGEALHQIPVGPVHAGIIEPGHFRFTASGETIVRLEERLGYVHKGIEGLLAGATLERAATLAGRCSGDTTVAYACAFAQAVEGACGIAIPRRAAHLRALLLELERIANHFGDIGAVCNDAAFAMMHAHCAVLRERVLRACEAAFGHRLMMDVAVPGGAARDLERKGEKVIRRLLGDIRKRFPALVTLYEETASLQDRTVFTGVLRHELAVAFAAGGFVGRASGREFDARKAFPAEPYDALRFEIPTRDRGDVDSRVRIRIREIEQSVSLIEQILDRMPEGDIRRDVPPAAGEGLALVEGFRGDIFAWVRTARDGTIARAHLRDPSWFQWPLLEAAIEGNIVADFPLCNKSFNCSYAGHDL